jgi:hypothetical protein
MSSKIRTAQEEGFPEKRWRIGFASLTASNILG